MTSKPDIYDEVLKLGVWLVEHTTAIVQVQQKNAELSRQYALIEKRLVLLEKNWE